MNKLLVLAALLLGIGIGSINDEYHDPHEFCKHEIEKWQSKYQTLLFDSGCEYDDANIIHCPWDAE